MVGGGLEESITILPMYRDPIGSNNENITNEDLTFQLDSMMKKAEDGEVKWNCKVCGKTVKGKNWGSARQHMREHVETHIEGLSYTCNQCGKASR